MSNQENWRRFILAIRNNGLQYKDGKWNSWVVLNQLWNCNLQQHFGHYEYWTVTQKWINFLNCNFGTLRFWTTFLGLEHLYEKTKHVVSPLGLNFEFSMRNNRQTLTDSIRQCISQITTLYDWILNLRRRLNLQFYF